MSGEPQILDQEDAALDDIANAPSITERAPDEFDDMDMGEGPGASSPAAPKSDDREDELDKAAAGAMQRGFATAYRSTTGDELDQDSAAVLSEWLTQSLDLCRRCGFGFWPRFTVLTACAGLILAPAFMQVAKTFRGQP
jgi:hypothetical protein